MEKVRNGVQIVAIVVRIGVLYVLVMVFQFDEYQRQSVHIAHHVSPALVYGAFYPQLPYGNKLVVVRHGKVYHASPHRLRRSVRFNTGDRHSVTHVSILLLVYLNESLAALVFCQALHGFRHLLLVHPRIETLQSQPQVTHQHHFTLALPTESALLSQHLAVIGIHGVPAKLLFQKFGSTLLYEQVFAVVFCHSCFF